METTDYEKQANDFLTMTDTTLSTIFESNRKYFTDDEEPRDVYTVTLSRNNRKYVFSFGQSLIQSGKRYVLKKHVILTPGQRKYFEKHPEEAIEQYALSPYQYTVNNGIPPTAYDILSCLTKHDPGLHEDFCSEYGYDTEGKRHMKQ